MVNDLNLLKLYGHKLKNATVGVKKDLRIAGFLNEKGRKQKVKLTDLGRKTLNRLDTEFFCAEWGEFCLFGLKESVQETCLQCWENRLSAGSKVKI